MKYYLIIGLCLLMMASPVYSDKDDINQLKKTVKDTSYGNYWERLSAIEKLGKMVPNKEALETLIELLGDKEPPICESAVEQLKSLKEYPDLFKWFCEKVFNNPASPLVRANAAWLCRHLANDTATPYLIKALGERETIVVVKSLEALGVMASAPAYFETIGKKLSDGAIEIREAAALACGGIKDTRVYDALAKRLNEPDPEVRAVIVETLGKNAPKKCEAEIIKSLKDYDSRVRIAAVEALVSLPELSKSDILKWLGGLINDRDWQVRAAAIGALRRLRNKDTIQPLIQQLVKEKGRLRYDIVCALKNLTGKSLGYDTKAWQSWFEANKDKIEITKDRTDEPDLKGSETVAVTRFFDVPVFGKNIIFIIDFSGSMKTEEADNKKKIDIARQELANALAKFTPDMCFNIILMSTEAAKIKKRIASKNLLAASETNKKTALDFVASAWDKLEDIRRGRGDMYDALLEALAEPAVDTIFILSDGKPTYGQYLIPANIIEHISRINRFRKVQINTILTGKKGTAQKLMEDLARTSGGIFMAK